MVQALQQAVQSGDYRDYQRYASLVNRRPITTLRDLLALRPVAQPLALEQVEAESALFQRFDTAAMSIGALSPEAHEALAQAMNGLAASPTPAKAERIRRATTPIKPHVSNRSPPGASASRPPIWSTPM
ncbi:glutamate synthase-related protein [Edwardsiella anguillarum]|nr:glutamate synthase-related protein [Edwardsiella anguillarum]